MSATINTDYVKRQNDDLFERFSQKELSAVLNVQNYIPIYDTFFALNDTNYNSINLNHPWYLSSIKSKVALSDNVYKCVLKNIHTNNNKRDNVFIKMAPLLDPFKYITGKYDIQDPALFKLPKHVSQNTHTHPKMIDHNNSAYVDGMFSFLSGQLIDSHRFIHGIEYYGSFIGTKQLFKTDVIDDIDYLHKCEFFKTHKDKLFRIEAYEHMLSDSDSGSYTKKKAPIKIEGPVSLSCMESISNQLFEDLFTDIIDPLPVVSDTIVHLEDLTGSEFGV